MNQRVISDNTTILEKAPVMKSNGALVRSFALFVLLIACAQSAEATIIFADNFDSETNGSNPTNWIEANSASADVDISNVQSVSTPRSMRFVDSNTSGIAAASANFFTAVSGVVTWEFSFRETSSINAAGLLRARLRNASNVDGILISTNDGPDALRITDGDAVLHQIGLTPDSDWYKVTVIADTISQTSDVYLNDSLVLSDISFTNTVSEFANTRFDTSLGRQGTMYIDDVLVSISTPPVPEPSSVALLALGSIFLVSRRKQRDA